MADKKKKNVFVRIFKYLRECFGELKKITWPTFSTTTKNFAIVMLVILVVGLFIYGLDRGLYALLGLINIQQVGADVPGNIATIDEVVTTIAAG